MSSYDSSDNDISQNEINDEVVLWYEDPNVLLKDLNELFPLGHMEFNRKINALTRLIILLTFLAYFVGQSVTYLISGVLSLVFIYYYSLY